MGWFGRKPAGPDWAHDPLPGDPTWLRRLEPEPNLVTVADRAIAASGVDLREVDRVEVLIGALRGCLGLASYYFTVAEEPDRLAALDIVAERDDVFDVWWRSLTYHGAAGIALQQKINEDLADGVVQSVLVRGIRDGEYSHRGLGGKDRI